MENTDYKYYKNILDKLLNGDFATTREDIARQGYGLDKLVNDESIYVRNIAKEMLRKETSKIKK